MMDRPLESLKSFSNRLAQTVASADVSELIRMLRLAGLLGSSAAGPERNGLAHSAKVSNPDRVGIWQRDRASGDAHFVRSMDAVGEWFYWANVGRIEAKNSKPRIVLVGESVARGYLYDPEFTPALALQATLESVLGENAVEVIDLARTNLGFEVQDLAISALALEPDAVIVFSGNNWRCPACPETVKAPLGVALRQNGTAGLKSVGTEWLAQRARILAEGVAAQYQARGIPLIWIVPEFNLGDWRIPPTIAPHLPGNGNQEWMSLLDRARAALAAGQVQSAMNLAQEAVELDSGTCVTGWQLLAECSLRQKDFRAARHYLEAARDAVHWYSPWSISPGITSLVQQILRETAATFGNDIVDLPRLFSDHLGGQLPGRRLFLDYCHLTSEGIRITMAAAAACVLRALKSVDASWRDLAFPHVAPTAEIEGEAAFLAAIHNAHWWQSPELVRHYCMKAIQLAPHLSEIMSAFLEMQTRRAPMLMCRTAETIAQSRSSLARHYLLHYNHQHLDRVLLDGVVAALSTSGINAQQTLDQMRREEHSVAHSPLNLLDSYYYSASLAPEEVLGAVHLRDAGVTQSRNYKAYWRESRFLFVAEAGCPVRFTITCRLPQLAEGDIFIEINGVCKAELRGRSEWTAWDIVAPGTDIVDGLNYVTVHWPMPEFPGSRALETIVADVSDQLSPEFFCPFGEIESFVAVGAPEHAVVTETSAARTSDTVQVPLELKLRRRPGIRIGASV